jgi:uncharacterized protein (DUF983 family)
MSYFSNRCPHCEKGRIFKGIVRMNPACTECGVRFERESGYFIGAMIASYFLGVFLALPTLLAAVFAYEFPMNQALVFSSIQILVLQPFLFRTSRILWIRIEAALTRSIHR